MIGSLRNQCTAETLDALRTVAEAPRPIFPALLPLLRTHLDFEEALAYRAAPGEGGAKLELCHAVGFPSRSFERTFGDYLAKAPGRFARYDHVRPEPEQRNTVLESIESRETTMVPIVDELYRSVGIFGKWQLRVLLCDGASLLAWFGGFRAEPFGAREKAWFEAIVPGLVQRLTLERKLADAEDKAAALDAAMEALSTEAYLVGAKGAILHANRMGRLSLDRDGEVREDLRQAILAEPAPEWSISRVEAGDAKPRWLAVRKGASGDPRSRALLAATRWKLTPRQSEVLVLLSQGKANKSIADTLGCQVGTIELHVTALLQKAGADNRADLAARFWTLGGGATGSPPPLRRELHTGR